MQTTRPCRTDSKGAEKRTVDRPKTEVNTYSMTEKIEFESVTIQVPKPILAFLRFQGGQREQSVEEEIIYDLLDNVRAELESMAGEELIPLLGLGPIFYDLLGDKRYKPQTPKEQ